VYNLSDRSSRYLELIWKDRCRPSEENVRLALNLLEIPPIQCFVSALTLLNGVIMKTPLDHIHWFPLPVINNSSGCLEWSADEHGQTYVVSSRRTSSGLWLNACSGLYPGPVYLWERGSIHFECDPSDIYFSNVYLMIEQNASVYETVGETVESQVAGIIKCDSVERLESLLGLSMDVPASDRTLIFKSPVGLVSIPSAERISTLGHCGAVICGPAEFVRSVLHRLGDKIQMNVRKGIQ